MQRSVSGNELRMTMQQYPLTEFGLSYEFLRSGSEAEFQTLVGFFCARLGSFDSFLFSDPDDNAVTNQAFGTGTGSAVQFQLRRSIGGGGFLFDEPVNNVNVLTNIKVAGVTKSSPADYSISSTGLVTFVTAPASGAALTWTGSFYYRVRFLMDLLDMDKFMDKLWAGSGVDFIGATGNKV